MKNSLLAFFFFINCFTLPLLATTQSELPLNPVTVTFDKREIMDILSKSFPDLEVDRVIIEELKDGLSGTALYKIEFQGKSYVLRMHQSGAITDQDALDFFVLIEAAKKGISPQIIYVSPDNRSILMEFINDKTLTIEQGKSLENVVRLANAIRESHQIVGHTIEGESLLSKANRCFQKVLEDNLGPKEEIVMALELVKKYSCELTKYDYTKVHVHGDLNPRNIFITHDRVLFIDWAETTLEDPFYDLSYCSLKLDYDKNCESLLITSYLQRLPSFDEWNRYQLHKKIHQAFWSLTNLYLADVALKKNPEQKINTQATLEKWGVYQKRFADCLELSAQYFYELSRLNYQLAK